MLQLKGRTSELEAELAEQQHLRQQAADESEFLRAELDELKKKREDTEKAQRSLTEIESEELSLGWACGWGRGGRRPASPGMQAEAGHQRPCLASVRRGYRERQHQRLGGWVGVPHEGLLGTQMGRQRVTKKSLRKIVA